ncbi:MAG: tetratricopeptide repeat protein [Anaerolineae bacterium]|nr:tetratricopeptide repeat protein [Anaerolineae bacterium]
MLYKLCVLALLILAGAGSCRTPTPEIQTTQYIQTGDAHREAGEYTAAESDYLQAQQIDKEDATPALKLAQLYAVWGRPEEGLNALDEVTRRGGGNRDILRWRITLLGATGNWEQVQAEAQAFLQTQGDDASVLEALTQAYMQVRQCSRAAEVAERWYVAEPEEARDTWGALTGAMDALCQTGSQNCIPDCAENCDLQWGYRLLRENAWPQASCVLERALAKFPDTAEGEAWFGEALARMGYSQEALIHFEQATSLNPDEPSGWLLLGIHLLRQGDTPAAREALLQAHKLDPANPATCLAIAEVKAANSQYDEVKTWIEAALERAKEDGEIWKSVARFYLERDFSQDKLPARAAEGAVERAPQDAEAQMLLGWIQLTQGNATGALATLDKAIQLAPEMAQAHYLRGLALQLTGETEAAEAAFIHAADLGYRIGQ